MSPRLTLLLLLAAAALGVLLHREQRRATFDGFDRGHREFLRANPGANEWPSLTKEPRVVLARLDDRDLPPEQRAFDAWPPTPQEWQVVFQNVKAYAPRTVAMEIPLAAEPPAPGYAESAAAVPGLVLGAAAANSMAAGTPEPALPPGLTALRVTGPSTGIPTFDTLTAPGLKTPLGVAEVDLGQRLTVDGEWCRVPMLARSGNRVVPTLALRALLLWAGVPPEEITVNPGTAIRGPKGVFIPIDEEGCFRYYLPLTGAADSVEADDLLFTKERAEATYDAASPERKRLESIHDTLLWVGADDRTARRFRLPDGNSASSAELTARALAAVQTGRFIRPQEESGQAIVQAGAILFGLWFSRWKKRNLWKGFLIGGIALLTVSLLAFQTNHTWVPLAPSLLQLLLAFTAGWIMPRNAES